MPHMYPSLFQVRPSPHQRNIRSMAPHALWTPTSTRHRLRGRGFLANRPSSDVLQNCHSEKGIPFRAKKELSSCKRPPLQQPTCPTATGGWGWG